MRRREFLYSSLAALARPAMAAQGWDAVPEILARVRVPQFPNRDFDVTRYGASGDGKTDCRGAFRKAIEACRAAGGGRVVAPAGNYLVNGPIHLESNVNLHVAEGATILFGLNPADYLPVVLTRWEGTRCYNYSPLIYAWRKQNVAITGRGAIDGRTQQFWQAWKKKQTPDQNALRDMGARKVDLKQRVFGAGHFLRPSLLQPYECHNLLVEDVTIKGSPFWTVHPVFCTNVTVRRVHILPGTTNDDGVDPDSSRDVLIEDCIFETADDNIAIKSGRDQDAWGGVPTENVVIRRCKGVRSRASGYCIGSEMSGDVRNVFIEDNTIGDVSSALYVKSNSDRGGVVENIWMRRNRVEACDYFIKLETDYKDVVDHPYPSVYRNMHFEDVQCKTARKVGIWSVGVEAKPISGVYLKDVTVGNAAEATRIAHTREIAMDNVKVNGKAVG